MLLRLVFALFCWAFRSGAYGIAIAVCDSMTTDPTTAHNEGVPQMDVQATVDAIALLDRARLDGAGGPLATWQTLSHAAARLNRELAVYFNPEKASA